MARLIDLSGETFGRLAVMERGPNKGGKPHWWCMCSCGTRSLVGGSNLRSGNTRSCGCLKNELAADRMNLIWPLGQASIKRLDAARRTGPSHPRWRGDDIEYAHAHRRVKNAKGAPGDQVCVGCGLRAAHWALIGGCASERVSAHWRTVGMTYCPAHPECYEARCAACHKKFDNSKRGAA